MADVAPEQDMGFFEKTNTSLEEELKSVLREFLKEVVVKMGDGSVSERLCALCEQKANPAHAVCACPCHKARELLAG